MKQTFEIVGEFKEGLARIKKFGNYGFVNEAGEQVIACNFSDANDFCEGLARVKKFGKFGFIDKNGIQVIECKFDDANDFCNGFAKVKVNGKWLEIDSSGKDPNVSESSEGIQTEIGNVDVIKLKKDESENKAEISKDDVVISDNNKVEKSIKIDDIKSSTMVKNMVEIDGKWHEVGATNSEGKIEISKDGNFVIVDENNNKVEIPINFARPDALKDMLSNGEVQEWTKVSVNGKSEFFDKDNNKIIPSKDGTFVIHDGDNKIEISKDGNAVIIDGNNKVEIPLNLSDMKVSKESSTVVKNMININGKWQEIDGEEKFGQNDIKVVPLKDEDTMVKDDKNKKSEISKNGNTVTANEANKKENLSQASSSGSLKKGSIKHNVRDWFEEKEKKSEGKKEESSEHELLSSVVIFIVIILLVSFFKR